MIRKHKKGMNKGSTRLITAILVLALILFLFFLFIIITLPRQLSDETSLYFANKSQNPPPTVSITPTPMPIASGKHFYTIASGTKTGPIFKKITFDPLDPQLESTQTVSAQLEGDSPIVSVFITLISDNNIQTKQPLTLTSGTSTSGTWETDILYQNSYLYIYNFTLVATDETGKTKNISLGIR